MRGSDCVRPDHLRAFLLGELPEEASVAVASHLEGCPTCEAAAQQMDALADRLVQSLRQAIDPAATASAPTLGARRETSKQLPEWFGRYRIVGQLGQGGMGTVYLAEDTHLGRTVALKIPRFADGDPQFIERFQREARIAATFHHPNLCPLYDVGQIDGIHYLTMPFLRGEPLSARLRRDGRLPPREAASLAARIARALQVAHQAGVLHRDLKPANVLIDDKGEPIIVDFGLARRPTDAAGSIGSSSAPAETTFGWDARLTDSAVFVGTPAYAPPEQVGGGTNALGPACDVYSLGVSLYEMLTGRLPFQGSPHEMLRAILVRDPEPPSHNVADLDAELESICLKALAKDPAARFSSMAAFADALEGMLSSNETASKAALAKSTRKRRLAGSVSVLLGLAGVALLIVLSLMLRGRWQSPSIDAVQPGSRWSGQALWEPARTDGPQITFVVHERDGDKFTGTYTSVEDFGRFQWRIEGTVRQGSIQWRFTEAIEEPSPTGVVENARVEGTQDGETMELKYHDADSKAWMILRQQKE